MVGILLSTSLAAGADLKVVQDMLGHSSIVLTADTYTIFRAPRGRTQGRLGRRHAHHSSRVPCARHHPATPARAARPWWRRPEIWQPRPPWTPSQSPSTHGPGHQQEPAQRERSGAAAQRAHAGAGGKRASGHTTANLCPYRHADKRKDRGKTPGQNGCAARDSNPEPAD